ncbi:MAG TPA: hypothetical protein VGJ26_19065 [Pirellulales bacterium]|jgi:hypothetical protein
MRYEFTIESRGWITYVALAGTTAIVVWLAFHSLAFLLCPGFLVAWVAACVLMNRKWHGRVENGLIVLESFFWGRPRTIRISEIAAMEVHYDEGAPFLIFRYRNGKRRRQPSGIYKYGELEQFMTAVLEEDPSIDYKYGP